MLSEGSNPFLSSAIYRHGNPLFYDKRHLLQIHLYRLTPTRWECPIPQAGRTPERLEPYISSQRA